LGVGSGEKYDYPQNGKQSTAQTSPRWLNSEIVARLLDWIFLAEVKLVVYAWQQFQYNLNQRTGKRNFARPGTIL